MFDDMIAHMRRVDAALEKLDEQIALLPQDARADLEKTAAELRDVLGHPKIGV